jgi:hypothetical protein
MEATSKISIDPSEFMLHSERQSGGDLDCVHMWEPTFSPERATWKCIACGRIVTYDAWGCV